VWHSCWWNSRTTATASLSLSFDALVVLACSEATTIWRTWACNHVPVGSQRLLDGRPDQALDVSAWVKCAPKAWRSFGSRARSSRVPKMAGSTSAQLHSAAWSRSARPSCPARAPWAGEQAAVEAQNLAHHAEHLTALVHRAPERRNTSRERCWMGSHCSFSALVKMPSAAGPRPRRTG